MSNKRFSATEISRFLNERLQDRRAIRNSERMISLKNLLKMQCALHPDRN